MLEKLKTNLSLRTRNKPAKRHLYRWLDEDMAKITGEIGVDASCEEMKHFHLFKVRQYVGIDIDRANIEQGLRNHPAAIGLLCDLTKLKLQESSADICVSTHTLDWFEEKTKADVIAMLHGAVKDNGNFIFNVTKNPHVCRLVKDLAKPAENIRIRHYQNYLSHAYEQFVFPAVKGNKPLALVFGPLALLLFWLEYLTQYMPLLNMRYYVVYQKPQTGKLSASFDEEKLKALNPGNMEILRA